MKSRKIISSVGKLVTLATFCLCTVAGAQAVEAKIGFVSSERIMSESEPAKAANAKIEKEFSGRDSELRKLRDELKEKAKKLDRDMPVLKDSERMQRQRELAELDKELRRKQRAFREDLNQRRNEEIASVVNRANKAIKKVAKEGNYDIVLQDAIYVNPSVDITQKVLEELNK